MAIRKITEVNVMRLKKHFEEKLKEAGHNLTDFDLYSDEFTMTLRFTIDNFYKHQHQWPADHIVGKEFKDIVKEVLSGFDHEKHVARNGRRID